MQGNEQRQKAGDVGEPSDERNRSDVACHRNRERDFLRSDAPTTEIKLFEGSYHVIIPVLKFSGANRPGTEEVREFLHMMFHISHVCIHIPFWD